jgi:hypothetical protein
MPVVSELVVTKSPADPLPRPRRGRRHSFRTAARYCGRIPAAVVGHWLELNRAGPRVRGQQPLKIASVLPSVGIQVEIVLQPPSHELYGNRWRSIVHGTSRAAEHGKEHVVHPFATGLTHGAK